MSQIINLSEKHIQQDTFSLWAFTLFLEHMWEKQACAAGNGDKEKGMMTFLVKVGY